MRRFPAVVLTLALLLWMAGSVGAALTYDQSYYVSNRAYLGAGNFNDPLYQLFGVVEGLYEGSTGFDAIYATPTDTEPTAAEGVMYWDDSENMLKVCTDDATFTAIGSGTFTGGNITSNITMSNGVYMRSTTTTAQTTGVQVYDTDGSWENALLVTNGSTAAVALGDTAATLAIASSGGLNVTTAGAVTGVTSLAMGGALTGVTSFSMSGGMTADTYTLSNGAVIDNDTDTEVYITEGGEDIGWDFTNNSVTWKSSTGVVAMNFGDVDALSEINTIAMDASASSITLTSDGTADDFTVGLAGATNSSLILSSTGTAEDALQVTTSAGGINVTNGGAADGEDLDLVSTNASIILNAGEDVTDAITLTSAGGITGTATDDVTVTLATTGTGEDLSLLLTGATDSSILLTSAGTGADAIGLAAAAGTVKIAGDQLDLDSTNDLALTVTSSGAGEDMLLTQTGGNDSSITLSAAGTGADAIGLQASGGGIDVDAKAAYDVDIAGGQVLISSKDNATSAIALTANVGATETIVLTNTQGTNEAAVSLIATAGGINLDAASTKNITLDGGQIDITSLENTASAISLNTNVGSSETIVIANTQGAGLDAINIDATAGGIDVDAANDVSITVTSGEAGEDLLLTQSGANNSSITLSAAGTGTDAIGVQASAGGIDIDAAATFDVAINGGQVLIEGEDNVASSVALTTNNGSTETIVVTNTQGTAEGAITLTSTAGGIDLNAATGKNVTADGGQILLTSTDAAATQIKLDATGAIDGDALILETTNGNIFLNADGSDYGDIDLDAADDMTLTAAGNLTLAVTGTYSLGGAVPTNTLAWIEVIGADDTLLANESGKTIVVDGNDVAAGDVVLTLPTAAAGLWFNFIDVNSTAADDLVVTAAAGDTINGGSAAGSYRCSGDAAKQHVTLIAVDATRWEVAAENGTWANE